MASSLIPAGTSLLSYNPNNAPVFFNTGNTYVLGSAELNDRHNLYSPGHRMWNPSADVCLKSSAPAISQVEGQEFRFKDLVPEIRNKIYTIFFQLHRSVRLVSDRREDLMIEALNHVRSCPLGRHETLSKQDFYSSDYKFHKKVPYCTAPFTREKTIFEAPLSCLALLLVDKQISDEAMEYFYYLNHFAFHNIEQVLVALRTMGKRRTNAIRSLSFRFTSHKANLRLQELARLAPNLEHLSLLMDFDQASITLRKYYPLSKANGMKMLRNSFDNLLTLNLDGRDQIKDQYGQLRVVQVNDAGAVGPWLRKEMIKKPNQATGSQPRSKPKDETDPGSSSQIEGNPKQNRKRAIRGASRTGAVKKQRCVT